MDRTRALRGAVCGAIAAGVWAIQQPLDKSAFGSRFDDVELLGKVLTTGQRWYVPGLTWHLQNGALFGALYAQVAPAVPTPPWLRGPVAGLTEHLLSWPLTVLSDRVHPRQDELPTLWGNRRAFAQATWRHLLFGVVLGELERRLNPPAPSAAAAAEAAYSSNGHGSLEHALSA
jgi:hypothetical protein